MRMHGDEVLRFCASMLADVATAEDVRQTVFIEAFAGLPSYAGRGSLRGWLFGIARHRCLDAARTQRRWNWRFWANRASGDGPPSAGAPDPTSAAAPADAAVPEDRLDEPRRLAILRSCLGQLPADVRVLVLLRYEQDLPYEEIARMSRERAATVQARVARALPRLRTCVESKGVGT
jgi:RNA polymerase sigma factor (sigma-70 family)